MKKKNQTEKKDRTENLSILHHFPAEEHWQGDTAINHNAIKPLQAEIWPFQQIVNKTSVLYTAEQILTPRLMGKAPDLKVELKDKCAVWKWTQAEESVPERRLRIEAKPEKSPSKKQNSWSARLKHLPGSWKLSHFPGFTSVNIPQVWQRQVFTKRLSPSSHENQNPWV